MPPSPPPSADPLATEVATTIRVGDIDALRRLLAENPGLATARVGVDGARTLLHVATDWPGHFPRVAETIAVLVAAGAEVDARFDGSHSETPLHWAASCDDVEALDALLDAGADIDADGSVIGGGTPLRDATAFAQWEAARRLVARGAQVTLFDAAALGLTEQTLAILDAPEAPEDGLQQAFWSACHGGRLETARALVDRGAEVDWIPDWEGATALDAAARAGAYDVVGWLHGLGAHTCDQVRG